MTHARRSRQERFQAMLPICTEHGTIWGFVPDDSWIARDGVLRRLATYRPCCQDPRNRRPDGEPCALASADVLDTRASYRYVRDVTCSCGRRVNAHERLLEPPGSAVPVFGRGDACACAWGR
jgi:hypothetical protein